MFASNVSDTEEYSTLFKPKLSIKLTNKPKSPVLMIKREKVTFQMGGKKSQVVI